MATSTRSTHRNSPIVISPPDWKAEALVTHRAVWEIAAMAGNVAPQLAAVKAKKDSDLAWGKGYERIVRLMTNALSSTRGSVADHVYYEQHRSGNAALTRNLSKLRQVRVEVVSAIEFLWSLYGESSSPEGLRVIHQRLRSRDAPVSKQAATEAPAVPIDSVKQRYSPTSTAHRDQRMANATKEINRLRVLVYSLARELYGAQPDGISLSQTLRADVLGALKSAGFQDREGFKPEGLQSLLDKCLEYAVQAKNNP